MSEHLQVALLTREYPPEVYGGAGVHVEQLTAALGSHVELAVHCFGEPRADPAVAGTYTPWEALAGTEPHLAALRWISADLAMAAGAGAPDVVHSHTWYTNLAGHLVKLLWGVPHVVTTHSLEPLRPWKAEQLGGGYALSSFCERTAIEAADAVIAVSAGMRADVLAAYPAVDPDRVQVIHNGVDPTVFAPVAGAEALTRRGVDPDRPAVVFVGRITRQKGLEHLLRAARELPADAQLVLCAGQADTPELAAEIEALVAALRAERAVHWIAEMLPREELAAFLSHASVFVCPSVYEPFGLVNLEAMACAAPVVATATGGIPEVVVEGETGLLVAPADDPAIFAERLAAAIIELLGDPQRARALGEAGRARVLEHFTWQAVAERTAALYEALANAG